MSFNLNACAVCPKNCRIDRTKGVGACNTDSQLKIARYALHFFEEPIISGENGSGTVFFCGCSLRCAFCQNFEVSRNTVGRVLSVSELADIFFKLEKMGAHNINLVSPTHYAVQIVEALKLRKPNIPVVWNTHGYEKVETLKYIDNYVDVYLTDLKYYSADVSMRYAKVNDYYDVAIRAIEHMLNKPTVIENGLMKSGVIVRHLILPSNSGDSVKILENVIPKMKNGAYFSLMAQYTPFGEISAFPEINRKITQREYDKVVNKLVELEYPNAFLQERTSSSQAFIPAWDF